MGQITQILNPRTYSKGRCRMMFINDWNTPWPLDPSLTSNRRDFNNSGPTPQTWHQASLWFCSSDLKVSITSEGTESSSKFHWSACISHLFHEFFLSLETPFVVASPPPLLHSKHYTLDHVLHLFSLNTSLMWTLPTLAYSDFIIL